MDSTIDMGTLVDSHRLSRFPGGFAVLMAVYLRDDAKLFAEAVDSVFANSLPPDAFCLVADGPLSDELETILDLLQQKYINKIILIRLAFNQGLSHALNAGLHHITQPWVVRADADDFNLPRRFEILASMVVSEPNVALIGSAILEVDANGKAVAVRRLPLKHNDILRFAKSRNPFNHMSVAYKRDAVLTCGAYPDMQLKEDYALWCLMLAKGFCVANTDEILVHASAGRDMYRRRGGWRYAKSEWALQKHMVTNGLKGTVRAVFDGASRAAVFLLPSQLRGWIYEKFLRQRNS
jgi:glycosyltransferase involved in cell wall biosynthesis